MFRSSHRALCSATAAILVVGLPSCEVYTALQDPQPRVGAQEGSGFRNAIPASRAGRMARGGDAAWWKDFRDRQLSGLVDEALAENPDLWAVGRRIDQANARMRQAGSALFPRIDLAADLSTRWDAEGDRGDNSSLGWIFDWEFDAWGRIRTATAARASERDAAYEDWLAARLLLSSAVAETWFELLEQRGQLNLASDQIDVNRTLLDLTLLRLGQGQGAAVDVLQQREQLQSTESRVPDIEARIEELERVLDSLAGRLPGAGSLHRGVDELPDPPPPSDSGYPVELLAQRPDLRARRARIVALDHEVGEAIADCYPRISIGASQAASGGLGLDRLVGDAIVAAVAPLFDGGERAAEVELRRARVEEEIDRYTSEFIAAVRDVEVALSREERLAERIRRQEEQLITARRLLGESKIRYQNGATDYLPVIDALAKVQDLERSVLTSRRERLGARVALRRALGGPMPEPSARAEAIGSAE